MTKVNQLLPYFITKVHDRFLECYLETGLDLVVYKHRELWVQNKLDFLIKIEAFVKFNLIYPIE